jgi:hypothetical protein
MHMSRLNEQAKGRSEEADAFLAEQNQHQQRWRQELGISAEIADQAYQFLQWCDRLSLILCQ